MTNVLFNETEVNGNIVREMTVTGHAGYAEPGKDIVCAGVSTLTCALVGFVENHGKPYDTVMDEGGGYAKVVSYQSDESIEAAFELTLIGMMQVEMAFPKYVTVSSKLSREDKE